MEIETVEELTDRIADWLGVYGGCKNAEKGNDCEEDSMFCCRTGFCIVMQERIREAVENDKKIEEMNLRGLAKQNGA